MRIMEPFCNSSLPMDEVERFTEDTVNGVAPFNVLALSLDGTLMNRLEVRT